MGQGILKQFIKFGIVGVSNTVLSYVLYLSFIHFFEVAGILRGKNYLAASVIAFLISVFWSFYWNNKYTFKQIDAKRGFNWKALMRTYASYSVTGLLLQNILLYVLIEKMNIAKSIAPLLGLTLTVPVNFLLNKYWAFCSSEKNIENTKRVDKNDANTK